MHEYDKDTLKDFEKTNEFIMKNLGPEKYNFKKWFDYIFDYVTNTKLPYNNFNRFLIYRKKSDEIWGQRFNDYFKNYQIADNELIRVK